MLVRWVPRPFVMALKMKRRMVIGQKQNGSSSICVLNPNQAPQVTYKIPPLPQGKSAIDVFADFIQYLHRCARTYVEETQRRRVVGYLEKPDRICSPSLEWMGRCSTEHDTQSGRQSRINF
jgi:hypothetical protein